MDRYFLPSGEPYNIRGGGDVAVNDGTVAVFAVVGGVFPNQQASTEVFNECNT